MVMRSCNNKRTCASAKFSPKKSLRDREGKNTRSFKQFKNKLTGPYKGRGGLRKMEANVGKKGEMKQSFEEKHARLSKMEGISLKGDFEQRRSGWSTAENKEECFECGNTDRFKAQFPIWPKEKENGLVEDWQQTERERIERKRQRGIGSIRVSGRRRNGPWKYRNPGKRSEFSWKTH